MGFFRRSRSSPSRPFWEVPPFSSHDPRVLYEHGINCVVNDDGPGMISTGWALWDLAGLNQHQAKQFLQDGYREWRNAGAPPQERMAFLRAVMARLAHIHPAVPPTADLEIIPRAVVAPAADYYATRSWAACALLDVAEATGERTPALDDEVYDVLSSTHPAFLTAQGLGYYRALAANRGTPPT